MVFVTVGSAQQSFRRLLDAVDRIAGSGGLGQRRVFMPALPPVTARRPVPPSTVEKVA